MSSSCDWILWAGYLFGNWREPVWVALQFYERCALTLPCIQEHPAVRAGIIDSVSSPSSCASTTSQVPIFSRASYITSFYRGLMLRNDSIQWAGTFTCRDCLHFFRRYRALRISCRRNCRCDAHVNGTISGVCSLSSFSKTYSLVRSMTLLSPGPCLRLSGCTEPSCLDERTGQCSSLREYKNFEASQAFRLAIYGYKSRSKQAVRDEAVTR